MGFVLCLVAASGFGLAPLFAKQAYAGGFSVTTMLTVRFALAALLLWAIVALRRRPIRMPARTLAVCVGLGAVGYALQGAAYFGAVSMIDASLAALLLYTYPALTLILGVALRRARADRRRVLALAVSGGGLIMLLGAGFDGGLGVLLALTAAGTYAVYLTVSETLPANLDVYLLTAIVCSSAAVSLALGGAATGGLHGPAAASAWLWVGIIAVIGTVLPITAMFAGVRLVGASTAAILCGLEPAITVVSTALVFGERLTAAQLVGGAAILTAVVILQLPARRRALSGPAIAQARRASISHRNAGTLGVNGSQPLIVPSSAQ
ncbi:drug/metabolite transporter (DMT)-like permease [Catenuloplanes nepalensis]|uniref:Drug/metabolite transporter (DMT)-like permease n=1 Tax=Catenuloplanes nepalensis TaxID=587533 RepID=A0ABT9MSR5_9ACTN|nr:DMT family transporter [Catenuloplanes nepalensis]MDP9794480.1 drug/metabolite transporter (DMT)-like permease [Catenuloplanes nepalensis]